MTHETRADKGLAACELELTRLLVELEVVTVAWHAESLALKRADLHDHHEGLLGDIAELEEADSQDAGALAG